MDDYSVIVFNVTDSSLISSVLLSEGRIAVDRGRSKYAIHFGDLSKAFLVFQFFYNLDNIACKLEYIPMKNMKGKVRNMAQVRPTSK